MLGKSRSDGSRGQGREQRRLSDEPGPGDDVANLATRQRSASRVQTGGQSEGARNVGASAGGNRRTSDGGTRLGDRVDDGDGRGGTGAGADADAGDSGDNRRGDVKTDVNGKTDISRDLATSQTDGRGATTAALERVTRADSVALGFRNEDGESVVDDVTTVAVGTKQASKSGAGGAGSGTLLEGQQRVRQGQNERREVAGRGEASQQREAINSDRVGSNAGGGCSSGAVGRRAASRTSGRADDSRSTSDNGRTSSNEGRATGNERGAARDDGRATRDNS